MNRSLRVILFAALCANAQTTQGILRGRVYDLAGSGALIAATLEVRNLATGQTATAVSSPDGYYAFAPLSPGTYWLRIERTDYQAREVYNLEIAVAARLELDVPLRRLSDVYAGEVYASYLPATDALVHVYAADLRTTRAQPLVMLLGRSGTLHSTLSYLIDPRLMRNLPLSGRDVYATLVALPGVTADSPTGRGLGLSINGQRASSSNFLLDGVENNDSLLTGPETVLAPEMVEEYRVSTNNFSAEFGRASGFIANAITRSGGNALHGTAYGYLNDTVLNANSYAHKAGLNNSTGARSQTTVPRQPQTEIHAGFWLGGPIRRDRTFVSGGYEWYRSRSAADPLPLSFPVLERMRACYPRSAAEALLTRFLPSLPFVAQPFNGDCSRLTETLNVRAPISLDRNLVLARADYVQSARQRWLARIARSATDRPDFDYSPYPDFSSHLRVRSINLAVSHLWTPSASLTNEWRSGWRDGEQGWSSREPDFPALITFNDGPRALRFNIPLPGTFLFPYQFQARIWEWNDTLRLVRGRHVVSAGGGVLLSRTSSDLRFRASGLYDFERLQDFGAGSALAFQISGARLRLPDIAVPRYDRSYRNTQFHLFVQDSLRLTPRLGMNVGVRYDSFGAPRNTGPPDDVFDPATGRLVEGAVSHYEADRNDVAARAGVFYDLGGGRSQTVLRAGYGIFYDRPFALLSQNIRNNSFELATVRRPVYPLPSTERLQGRGLGVPLILWLDRGLRTPYVQSWFAGIQQQLNEDLYLEWSAQGAVGRKLIGTDVVNRFPTRRFPQIDDDIIYRSNFVSSNYNAMTALFRYRTHRAHFQAAYTWGHSIDTQSDPLQGTFEDLQAFRSFSGGGENIAALTEEGNTRADRASSDFDQRHNLVFFSIWELPGPRWAHWAASLLNDWRIAQIAGFRSGFPFNVIVNPGSPLPACPGAPVQGRLVRPRPGLLPDRSPWLDPREPVPGGFRLLDRDAFCDPGQGLGSLGRNALTGPGFWNVDLSLAKSFRAGWLSETGAIEFRADVFNVFNHANLGNPARLMDFGPNATFGRALLGREGVQPSFPSATPLDQLPRQIQIQIKWRF